MAGFGIEVSKTDLDEVRRTMRGIKNGYGIVVSKSINKTLTGVRTDSVKLIRGDFVSKHKIKAKTLRPGFKFKKASQNNLTAAVRNEGVVLPLIHFDYEETSTGVYAKISKDEPRRFYKHAFVATVKGRHKGIYWRKVPPFRTKRSPKIPWKRFALDKMRLPIKQLYGYYTSPHTMNKPLVMKPILQKAGERLKKAIFQNINYELSKFK